MMTQTLPESPLALAPPPDPDRALAVNHLVGGDVVKQNLSRIGATPEQISAVLWLHAHAREQRMTTYKAIGAFIGYDDAKIGQIFNGKYGGTNPGSLANVCAAIEHARQLYLQRISLGKKPFVETQVVKDIKMLCDNARVSQTIAFVWGPNQSGKTWGGRRYRDDNNHGRTIFVRMPAGGGKRATMRAIARECKIPDRKSPEELRDRIHAYFDDSMLLMIDEFHQCLIGRTVKVDTVEAIREIHDECGTGIVLFGTDVIPDMMEDRRFKSFLGQMGNRGVLRKRIAPSPLVADVKSICHAYGMPLPEGTGWKLAREVAKEFGIGKLTVYLRMARQLAANKKKPLAWEHFATTHDTLESWAKTDESNAEAGEDAE